MKILYTTLTLGLLFIGIESVSSTYTHFEKINKFKRMSPQEAVEEVETPEEAEWYVRNFIIPKEKEEVSSSFEEIHSTRTGDCAEAVIAAGTLLSDDDYPPTYLSMIDSTKKRKHAVFLYEKDGKYGSVGINASDNVPPKFNRIEDLVKALGYEQYEVNRIIWDITLN